ncbi:MAG: AMP-binding protein [Saprospiraceae bacterium]|nr:AMP-binding protein [Saprospiraceae bacterium]
MQYFDFKNLTESDYYDRLEGAELEAFQTERFREMLCYVAEHSPYYSRVFKAVGFNPDEFRQLTDLRKLPFTDKEQLQKYNNDFLNVPIREVAEYVTTSGTLGDPVRLMLTERDLLRLGYNEARGLSIAGVDAGDIVQITTTLDRRFMAGLAYYLGCRLIGAATIRVGVGAPQLQWDTIREMNPTAIIGVPSFIVKLIEYARETGIEPDNTSVKKIICIGEPIREDNLEWNKVGQYIRSQWQVELFSTYASTEIATAFTECPYGQGGHQLNELIFTEVIDEEGNPVEDGCTGELVVTTLGMEGMPLIRFRTGDLVRKYNQPCACGRNSARLGPLVGRKGQLIKFKGTTIYPSAIQQIMDHLPEVETYVIEAVQNQFGEDHIQILLAVKGDKDTIVNILKNQCRSHLRVTPEFLFRDASYINHLRNRPEMRKPVIFIDNRMK